MLPSIVFLPQADLPGTHTVSRLSCFSYIWAERLFEVGKEPGEGSILPSIGPLSQELQ